MLTEAELFTVGSMVHDLAGLFHQESSLSVSLHLFISFLCSDFPRLFYCPAWRVIAWHHSGNQGVHVAGISKILTVHVHLIAFSVWYTLALNLSWPCSPETLFCSLQKKNKLQVFFQVGDRQLRGCSNLGRRSGSLSQKQLSSNPLYLRPSSPHSHSQS